MSATGIFLETFTRLNKRGIVPSVFYPAVQLPSDEEIAGAQTTWESRLDAELAGFLRGKRIFLSINRFERKKVNTDTPSSLVQLQGNGRTGRMTCPPTSLVAILLQCNKGTMVLCVEPGPGGARLWDTAGEVFQQG